MKPIPTSLDQKIIENAQTIEGWLQPREMRFLALAVINRVSKGHIIELGSYHGKSTSVLASTVQFIGGEPIVSVDPIDPMPLQTNLLKLGISRFVDVRNQTSQEFTANWNSPIGMLWHDGANEYDTVVADCQKLFPLLTDGAIVAFHDVLNASGERIHVFDEFVLNSPNFGWVGVCGSIGFGQYHSNPNISIENTRNKQILSRKLAKLKPYHSAHDPNPKGIQHIVYKIWRSRIAHGPLTNFPTAKAA